MKESFEQEIKEIKAKSTSEIESNSKKGAAEIELLSKQLSEESSSHSELKIKSRFLIRSFHFDSFFRFIVYYFALFFLLQYYSQPHLLTNNE